jgi:predicted secreted hydrolase
MIERGGGDQEGTWARGPWLLLIALALAVALFRGDWRPTARSPGADMAGSLKVSEVLSQGSAGFARAERVRAFEFPLDHGPHPDFRSEWWYLTANVSSADARRFGLQLTFFRFAVSAEPPPKSSSAWTTRQVYMAHFGLSDINSGRFHSAERFERGAVGLAGARAVPFRVWLHDWAMESTGTDTFPLRLAAKDGAAEIDLLVDAGEKAVVLQGDRGLSQKSAEPGNASYYYSFTRLPIAGTVRVEGEAYRVTGLAWLDREWSTSALAADQAGWDWFALQLDDGQDLMYYQLRRHDGGADPKSAGVMVDAAGRRSPLGASDVRLGATGVWRSPEGGRYPSGWRLQVPSRHLDLRITPAIADQEHRGALRYWEGAVAVEGQSGDRSVRGRGYVELTGYADAAPGN